MTALEPRLCPSTPWSAGWPESLRVYGHGIDDAVQVRVWVEDPAIAEPLADLLAPVHRIAVVTTRPQHLVPEAYISVLDGGEWLRQWWAKGLVFRDWESQQNSLVPIGVWVDGRMPLAQRVVTAAHEIGHVLGLGHSDDPANVMFGGGTGLSSVQWTEEQIAAMDGVIVDRPRSGF